MEIISQTETGNCLVNQNNINEGKVIFQRYGKVVTINGVFHVTTTIAAGYSVFSLPYRPIGNYVRTVMINYDGTAIRCCGTDDGSIYMLQQTSPLPPGWYHFNCAYICL